MPILMKYEGIPGESKIQGYQKYIEVDSFDFGLGRRITAGTQSTREGGTVSLSEIVVTKRTDNTTIKFFEQACVGKMDKKVEIAFVRTGDKSNEYFLKFELDATTVAGLSFKSAGGADARPTETIHLNFNKMTIHYNPVGDNLTGSPSNASWNIGESKFA
jgi:type VI secretion system secreted protein Hcp